MANTTLIKRRTTSVKNTRQITKAMELVSASKLKKAQERAFSVRPYRVIAYDILAKLSQFPDVKQHPYYNKREVKNSLYIVITSNGPLAGAYNANVLRLFHSAINEDHKANVKSHLIMIGKKGAQYAQRLSDIDLLAVYGEFSDQPSEEDIQPMLNTILDKYRTKEVDNVQIIYTVFKSSLTQIATKLNLLPAVFAEDQQKLKYNFTNFEPSIEIVLDNVTARLIEVQIWQALLESLASENSMRMVAMKNATDNANEIIDALTLAFNTARQANITQEIAEITGGAEALRV